MTKRDVLAAGAAALLIGFGAAAAVAAKDGDKATATIESKSGSKVTGKAEFTEQASGGTKVEIWIENATPGSHGLHLHEKGDCSAPDATSAGAHFNAAGNPHAAPTDAKHHNGDLGNIEADASGTARLAIDVSQITVDTESMGIVGRAVIVHEMADDLQTQPSGNSGTRLACGVIRADHGGHSCARPVGALDLGPIPSGLLSFRIEAKPIRQPPWERL